MQPPKIKKTVPSHKSVELAGRVVLDEGGKLRGKLNAPYLYDHFLKTYCKEGDYLSMKITNKKPSRSIAQNNYLHVYLGLISLSSGHSMKELKGWIRDSVLKKGVTEVFGETVHITQSTADLNISEFAELLNILEETTEIPLPDAAPFNLPLTRDEYGRLKIIQNSKYAKMKPKGIKIKKNK